MRKVVPPIIAMLLVTFLFWAGGFDFNERGGVLLWWAIGLIYAAGFAYLFSKDL